MYRVSLTSWTINQARQILFLVAGKGKAHVLHDVMEGDAEPERLPAQLINPADGELNWYIDAEAAGLLESVAHRKD